VVICLPSREEGDEKSRSDERFCNHACRRQHHYHARVKPAGLGKGSRKVLEPG
jgi:hypothetical protein